MPVENPVEILASCAACVQTCRAHSPSLFLGLCAAAGGRENLDLTAARDAFDGYAAKQSPQQPQSQQGGGAGRPGHRQHHEATDQPRLSMLSTWLGESWIVKQVSAGGAGMGLPAKVLPYTCAVDDFPPEVVRWLVRALLAQCEAGELTPDRLHGLVTTCLNRATPTHLSSLVRGLQSLDDDSEAPVPLDAPSLSNWHPAVTPALAKRCLQRVSDTAREQRGWRDALPLNVLQGLHACALCRLPAGLPPGDTLRVEIAILSMSALKYATYPQLACLYRHLHGEHVMVPAVLNRFLGNCGILLGADAGSDAAVPPAAAELLLQAVRALASSGRSPESIEEGLVHGSSVLVALGQHAAARAVYAQHPTLRVTPHLVAMYTAEGNVTGALRALHSLAASRPEGWLRPPPIVQQVAAQLCELVGRSGAPQDLRPLYEALVSFHSAGMILSQLMESVLAGIAERMRHLSDDLLPSLAAQSGESRVGGGAASYGAGPVTRLDDLAPRVVLEHVVPVTKAALTFIGDDANTDMILMLLETSLDTGSMAVPLTAALMRTLRQASSLSIRELFLRVDSSTHNLPFLYYYALCFARDRGLVDAVEHLSAVWRVDGQALLHRPAHLAPAYKLWKCAGCGRLNSDRFNYCVCSALRNGLVLCGGCSFGQDERWPACLRCGSALGEAAGATCAALVRKAWNCTACNASNPARQTLLCFRCSAPTGPLSQAGGRAAAASMRGGCDCGGGAEQGASARAYHDKVGYCRCCGQLSCRAPAKTSTAVWTCAGCQQLRSALERSCPSCPQVECLPFATAAHRATSLRYCAQCGAEEPNGFASACSHCGAEDLRLTSPSAAARAEKTEKSSVPTTGSGGLQKVLSCAHCGSTQLLEASMTASTGGTPCHGCGAALSALEDGIMNALRECPGCHSLLPLTAIGAACPHCVHYVAPPPSAAAGEEGGVWQPARIRHTLSTLLQQCSPDALAAASEPAHSAPTGGGESSADAGTRDPAHQEASLLSNLCGLFAALGRALAAGQSVAPASLHEVRVELLMALNVLLGSLQPAVPRHPVARRAAALAKQLVAAVDARCGFASPSPFAPEEVCHECLGGHPAELCVYAAAAGDSPREPAAATWACGGCGVANSNEDLCRYLCTGCLTLRPAVQELFPTECWECAGCHRANVEFETYCTHCRSQRPAIPVSNVSVHGTVGRHGGDGDGDSSLSAGPGLAAAASVANNIPFLPSRCALCGLVYLEANCPLCTNHLPDVAEAKGVVCAVGKRHAYIQPVGTSRPQDRIFVDEQIVRTARLAEGRVVHYLAELAHGGGGRGVGFRATHVR